MHWNKTIYMTILLPLMSFLWHNLNGQGFTQYNPAALVGASVQYKINPAEDAIDGSPYYEDNWLPATIYLRNNTYVKVEKLKYNLYQNELIFLKDGQPYVVAEKAKVDKFTLGNENFKGAFDGKEYLFYKVIVPGKPLMLLEKSDCRIAKGQPSKGYVGATPDKYYTKKSIHIIKPDNNTVEINPKRATELLSYIPDKSADVESYIKMNKLKMRTLKDLIDVVNYYNSISNSSNVE